MPFWKKVFGKKSDDKAKNRDVKHTTEIEESKASPAGEKRNFNYNLSVSRSGRYKSKERKRTALAENPALFDDRADRSRSVDNGLDDERRRRPIANNSSDNGNSPALRGTKSEARTTSQKQSASS